MSATTLIGNRTTKWQSVPVNSYILDYNPVAEFWVDSELVNDADSEMIVLTYKDNEALDKSIVNEIEKARDRAETSNYWAELVASVRAW